MACNRFCGFLCLPRRHSQYNHGAGLVNTYRMIPAQKKAVFTDLLRRVERRENQQRVAWPYSGNSGVAATSENRDNNPDEVHTDDGCRVYIGRNSGIAFSIHVCNRLAIL